MTAPSSGEIPLYETDASREVAYGEAQESGQPYLAVESHDDAFAVVYDLLPAGAQLTSDAHDELVATVTDEIEGVVADPQADTVEVSHSVGLALGSLAGIADEATARSLAGTVAAVVLEETNWTTYQPQSSGDDPPIHTN
jgi:hypothetical protein